MIGSFLRITRRSPPTARSAWGSLVMGHALDHEARAAAKRLSAWILLCALLSGLILFLSGCGPEEGAAVPGKLRVGVLPDEEEAALRDRYTPLLRYLNQVLDVEVELVVPRDYASMLSSFAAGEIDLGNFGGVTFVKANEAHGAEPLVLRDIDLQFTTFFLSRPDEPRQTIEAFQDQRFAFGSELSTSGHFMPRYFMQAEGLVPERFFSTVEYSGSHDATVYWVRDGKVDLGAVNSEVVDAMLADGRLVAGEVRVVLETPPYADYVWAVQASLDPDFVSRLRSAFLELSPSNDADAEILSRLGAGGFLPARNSDFERLREVISSLEAAGRDQPGKAE